MEGKKESLLSSVREKRIGGAHTLKNQSEGELFREMLTLHNQSGGQAKREEVEISENDKPCLTKMMMPPLACMASRERMPDREWVQSEHRAEGIPSINREQINRRQLVLIN